MSLLCKGGRKVGSEIKNPALSLQETQRQGRGTRFGIKTI
jgi:hypothetical protein